MLYVARYIRYVHILTLSALALSPALNVIANPLPPFLCATLKHVANVMQRAEDFVLERALVIISSMYYIPTCTALHCNQAVVFK